MRAQHTQAVRKRKEADLSEAAASAVAGDIAAIKQLPAEAIAARCLRQLGLAHTGEAGSQLEQERLAGDQRCLHFLEKAMQVCIHMFI